MTLRAFLLGAPAGPAYIARRHLGDVFRKAIGRVTTRSCD